MDCSIPGFPVFHYLPEFAQTHVHYISDVIQSSYPLFPPCLLVLNLSQFEGLVWVGSNAQTLLKAEMDAAFSPCTSREKEDPSLSLSKPLLMFEMCQIPVFTHYPHISSLP